MGYPASNNLRPIQINFGAYGGNDDAEFKHELIVLMANSVYELRESALQSISSKEVEVFRKAAHKAKSTLVLLDDLDFIDTVEKLRADMIASDHSGSFHIGDEILNKFLYLSNSIIKSLEKEAEVIRPRF
jgi:hypothetical protein